MKFKYHYLPLGLVLLASQAFAECGPEPEGFEPWPENEALPVESIPQENWFRTPQGWLVSPGRCQAVDAAWEREAAFEAFERHFARTPLDGAIVDVGRAGALESIRAAGAAWVLPWRFAAEPAFEKPVDPRTQAVREQIESQLASGGRTPDPEQMEKLLQSALTQLAPAAEPRANVLELTALRHEVAHKLFIEGVWPSTQPGGMQYGGDAPDWLDEAAAVAAESSEMTDRRRALFREAARDGRLIPLDRYLSMPHPVYSSNDLRQLMLQAREAAAQEGAAVMSASVSVDVGADGRIFYEQTRGWLDFLHEQTGNPAILAVVADAMKGGRSFEEWLTHTGSSVGLPNSLKELEAEFRTWASVE